MESEEWAERVNEIIYVLRLVQKMLWGSNDR